MSRSLSSLSRRIPPTSLPAPADAAQARRGIEEWIALDDSADLAGFARKLAEDAAGRRILEAVFGNSPFLTRCCLKEVRLVRQFVRHGPEAALERLIRRVERRPSLTRATQPAERAALMEALRIARRRVALLVALADITGLWSLDEVTGALSRFADAALQRVARHLLAAAAAAGEIERGDPEDPARDSGLVILGMGKLGGRELNYSSDIDLIILFDAEKLRYRGRTSVQQCAARLARELVRILEERTSEGYVFRADLRLRPDPASTPPALSLEAALTYYESAGQNWERAALIKARPVAGDLAAGAAFLAELRPFLWRKHLDFAAIQDIHSIKRQINAHRGGSRIAVAGHNVKLGRGGIREIEFFAQTQQLIWGGRMPELRLSGTCAALQALARAERVTHLVATEMGAAYVFLRRVEHRLQMVEDAQTHTLPEDADGLRRLAVFLGYADADAFADDLRPHLGQVEKHYARLFEEAPSLAGPGNLVFTGIEDDPETLATLRRLGFAEPAAVAAAIRGWHHGRYRAMRSQRAREIVTELVPALLRALGVTADPDLAFLRFDQFMARLPAGVQLFSLLHANPALLELVAEIMGGAPRLAEQLARHPLLLDGVLSADFFAAPPEPPALAAEFERVLAPARDYSDVLDLARRWANDRKFQIGVHLLRRRIDGEDAGAAFAAIADTVLAGLLPRVAAEFARAHGGVPGGRFAVIGLGKLGGREMTVTSDLDLILFYDAPDDAASDGARPLPAVTYFARLSQRYINALTAPTAEGLLYEVDMRLRPSGSAGPIASSLAAFRRYHDELAWTWEHMALTRARPVAGDPALAESAMGLIREVLTRPRDEDRLVRDIAEMRERVAAQHPRPSPFDVKHRRGGLVDAEFVAQYLMLRHARRRPDLVRANTGAALAALAEAGLIAPEAAADIVVALRLWRRVQGLLKLVLGDAVEEKAAAPALQAALTRGPDPVDFARLSADMDAAARRVLGHYRRIIEEPAAAARARLEEDGTPR